jgi:crossover junction endodeoxyribonuclease RusA
MIMLQLPWPPTVNHYWYPIIFRGRLRGMRISEDGRTFRTEVLCAVRKALGPVGPKVAGMLRVDVELRPPTRAKRDLDNYLKALFDALTHAEVWVDDNQIDELTVRRGRVMKGGGAAVIITELDGEIP